jgi:mannose-1-phosphate guanylyltransferase
MAEHYSAIIMAGGGGTRLWPLSRKQKPKQSLRLFGDRTLFQVAVDRLLPVMPIERIKIVTIKEQATQLQAQVPSLPKDNFILEPAPRGTASVVGLAAIKLQHHDPQSIMAVLTADHYIENVERFQQLLLAAYELAREGDLVTLGISPTKPDIGYGYIHRGEGRGEFGGYDTYHVKAFKEKPDADLAASYLSSGQFAWNSGMFVWRVDRILEEMARQMPNLYEGLMEIRDALGTPDEQSVLERIWQGLESETIDYGVMEGARNVSVIPADDLGWLDVGGWGRIFEIMKPDVDGNIIEALNTLNLNTAGTLIFQPRDNDEKRLIATLGIDDLVIVDTDDVLLICSREDAQRVRDLVNELTQRGLLEYL